MKHPVPVSETLVLNASAQRAPATTPVLSVLVPFYRESPAALLDRLAVQAAGLPVEVVVIDDGSNDAALAAEVIAALERLPCPGTLVLARDNGGRSRARNRLAQAAQGDYALFVDADMMPDEADYLGRWLAFAQAQRPAAAFGGFSVRHAPECPATALHKRISAASDCRPARERIQRGPAAVTTSNLLVRRDVLEAEPFSEAYVGWGYEDVDWALAVAGRWPIAHIDNTATHVGLEATEDLLRKYAQGGRNLALLLRRHPSLARGFPGAFAARLIARVPGQAGFRPLLLALARDEAGLAPMRVRMMAAKLYRASHAAEALA